MGKIIVSEFVTLDGIMHAPNEWSFPYWNDDIAKIKYDELFTSDALLLGRETYQGFAAAWPSRQGQDEFADRMNDLPKYVVSTTLKEATWNNSHLIQGNIPDEIARLKLQLNRDILVGGSAQLVQTLTACDLIDEYRLLVYPLVLGKGKRLFEEGSQARLKLLEARPTSTGVVFLHYAVERS